MVKRVSAQGDAPPQEQEQSPSDQQQKLANQELFQYLDSMMVKIPEKKLAQVHAKLLNAASTRQWNRSNTLIRNGSLCHCYTIASKYLLF